MTTNTSPRTAVHTSATDHTADAWTPLVDEPPPLDWELEDLFTGSPTNWPRPLFPHIWLPSGRADIETTAEPASRTSKLRPGRPA